MYILTTSLNPINDLTHELLNKSNPNQRQTLESIKLIASSRRNTLRHNNKADPSRQAPRAHQGTHATT